MKAKSLSILCVPLTGPCAGPDRLKKGGRKPVNKYAIRAVSVLSFMGMVSEQRFLLCFADWLNLANISYDGRNVFDRR